MRIEMIKKLLSIGIIFVLILLSGCSFAGNYYKDGKKSFEKGDYKVAADDFSKAIAANPNRAQYYIDYGLALVALGIRGCPQPI
jgi:tetratricopeptide (TPR) repeat protein